MVQRSIPTFHFAVLLSAAKQPGFQFSGHLESLGMKTWPIRILKPADQTGLLPDPKFPGSDHDKGGLLH